jgi:hypothetical protein
MPGSIIGYGTALKRFGTLLRSECPLSDQPIVLR